MAELIENPQARDAWNTSPQSLQELNEAVRLLFHCMQGPPMAYFEIPLASQDRYESGMLPVELLVYTQVGWEEVPEPRGQAAHQRLIDKMWHMFKSARVQTEPYSTHLLFWRRELEFEQGRHFPKDDHKHPGVAYLRLTCRLVIAGVDLSSYQAEWIK